MRFVMGQKRGKADISLLIPAYNEEDNIEPLAEKIDEFIGNSGYKIEAIIVNDGSTDRTQSKIDECATKYDFIVALYHRKNMGVTASLITAFKNSTGDYIFFTDADCAPHCDWIKRTLKHFSTPEIGVVAGSYLPKENQNWLAQCIHQEIIYRHINLMPIYPKSFGSYNFCLKRNLFEAIGGFEETYRSASAEDNDLSYKILKSGGKIRFAIECLVKHRHTDRLKKYLNEQFNHGFWRAKLYCAHPSMSKGDDYTFWKDIIEPPIVIAIFCSFGYQFFIKTNQSAFMTAGILTLILIAMEIFYGLMIMKKMKSAFVWAWVMFLRAFFRTFGFLYGSLRIFPEHILNNFQKK